MFRPILCKSNKVCLNKAFFSNYVFDKNTYRYKLNYDHEYNRLSVCECIIYDPITFTKEFFRNLWRKSK